MTQKNKKTSGSKINARWINNAMKSIGQASLSTFKDFAPTITDTASTVGKDLKSLRNIAKNTNGQKALAENKYIQVAKKTVGYAIEDLKNGKFFNADREDEIMAKSMGLDDFDFDFDDSDDSGDVTFNYIDEGDDGASSDAAFQISNTITESTNASLKASKATIDAMVSIAGTSLQQSQQIGSEVISYLGNIDNTLTSILEYQQENTTKFYEASLAFMEKMGPTEEDGSYRDDKVKSSDIMGSGGKLDIGKYKKYVQQQLKNVTNGSEAGTLVSMLSDPSMLEMMTANPVGAATKFIIGGITPKLVKGTIENVEEAFKDFMPTMLSRLNKWKDDASLGWIGTLKRTIGQVFGIDLESKAAFDLGGKVTKDAAVFDGVTRNAIVEVIPKYLRESTGYLKSIAEHFKIDTKNVIANTDVYSADENRYVKQKDLRKAIGQRLDSAATGDYGLSQFGKTLQRGGNALEGHDSKAYDRMVNQLFGFITRNSNNLSPEDINLSNKNSEFSKMLDKLDVGRKDRKAFNVLKETLRLMKENNQGTGDLASAQIRARGSLKSAVDDMSANFDMENLLSAGINDDTDIYELMDEAVGNKRNIALRARALKKARKEEKKNEKESDASFSEGYRRRSAKDLATEGFNSRPQKERDRDAQLANASPDSIMGTFATTGNHLRNGMYAAMNGDSKGFVTEMGKIFTDSLGGLWDSFHKSFIKPAVSALFGEKDENGYVQGGIVGGAQNKIKDTWGALHLRLTGKAYKDSQGKTHTTESEGIKSSAQIIKDTMKNVGDSIRFRLFGADDEEEGEDGKGKKKGIVNNLVTTMKAGIAGWKAALFGETDEDVEKSVSDIKKKAMDAIPDAGVGAIGGALVGGVAGGSLLGTLIGGPVGGAIVGMGLSFARKSTAFQDYVFGPKVEDADGNVSRVGGLISKATQNMFKDPKTKKSMIGGAALGIAKNVVLGSSGGLLGTLVGGPLAGAVIGAGFSLFKRSQMFQTFLYGDEKTGKIGLIKHFQNAMGKKRKKTDEEEASTAKKLGMTIIGAGGGAITAALVGKVGLLGAMLTPAGPIGGAIVGGALGIAGGMNKFKKMLFGEKDEESGKRKGGLMQKFGNFMHVEVMQPMKDLFLDIGEDLKTTIQYKVLDVIRTSVEPIVGSMKGFVDNIKKKATSVISDVGNEIKTNLIKPFLTIVSNVFAPVRKAGEIIAKTATKAAKSIITFPFKVMSGVARLITSPFRKMASVINRHLIKPIIKKSTSFIKGLFGGVGKLLNIGAAATNAVRYGIRTRFAGVGRGGNDREYRDDGTFRSERRRSNREYRQEMRENRKKRVERRNLDANRRQMAKLLGYDAKYFTEENYQKAMDAARAQNKRVAWAGGRNMTFDKDPEQVAREARAKAEQEKADRLKGKGNAELLNADTKDADVDMRLLVEDVKQTGLLERIVTALTGESPFGGILDKNGASGKKESKKSDAEKKEDSWASLEEEYRAKREESEDTIDKLTNEMIQSGGVGKWVGGKFKSVVDRIPGVDKAKNVVSSIEDGMGHAKNAAKEGFDKLKYHFSRKGKARAKGGPVEKGKATLVGDGGKDPSAMEVMVPNSNGKVLAQGKTGLRVFIAGVAKKAAETFGKATVDEAKKSNASDKIRSATLNTASGYFDDITNTWVSSDRHQTQIEKSIARHQKKLEKQNNAKASLEDNKKSGSFINKRAQKAAADKETQQAATLGEIAKNTKESAVTGKKSLFEWLKIFGKGGLIVAALIKFWPIIKKVFSIFGKVGLDSIIQTIGDIKDGISNIGNPLATLVEKVNDIANVFEHPGDIVANLKQLILGDDDAEGAGDAATVDRVNAIRKKGTKSARKIKTHAKSVKKTVKAIKNAVKGGKKAGEDAVEEGVETAGKNAAKKGGEATLDTASKNTERMIKENKKIISEKSTGYLDDSGKWVTSSKQEEQIKKSIARHNKKAASKGAATLETKVGKEGAENAGKKGLKSAIADGAKSLKDRFISMVTEGINGIVKKIAERFAAKNGGKGAKLLTHAKALTNLLKTAKNWIGKKFATISGKITALFASDTALGAATAGVGLVLKKFGFAIAGGLSEMSNPRRLFRLDPKEKPDWIMRLIAAGVGAFRGGLLVGACVDIADALLMEYADTSIYTEIATFAYRIICEQVGATSKADKLVQKQAEFKNKYKKEKESSQKKQYQAYLIAHGQTEKDYSYAQFKTDVFNKTKSSGMDSFSDYTANKNKTIGAKIADTTMKVLNPVGKAIWGSSETGYYDPKTHIFYKKTNKSGQYMMIRCNKVDKNGNPVGDLKELGVIAEENMPDKKSLVSYTKEKKGLRDVIKFGTNAVKSGVKSVTTTVKGVVNTGQKVWKDVKKGNLLGAGKTVFDATKKGVANVVKKPFNRIKHTYQATKSFFFADKATIFRNPSTKTYWKEDKSGKWYEYNVHNKKMSDKAITREQIQQMLQDGVVIKDTLTTKESGLTKTVNNLKKGIGNFADSLGKNLKNAENGLKSARKRIGKDFSNAFKGGKKIASNTVNNAKKWFTDKTIAYHDNTGKGYWDYKGHYYTENGERVEAKDITLDDLKDRLESGTLTKASLSGIKMLQKMGGSALAGLKKGLNNGYKSLKSGVNSFTKGIGKVFNSAKNNLKNVAKFSKKAIGNTLNWLDSGTKRDVYGYYTPDGKGYYTMNDDGTFNKYSMAGDLMEEKIGGDNAKLILDFIARGVYKKDKVDETTDLKESVKSIKKKVSEGWKHAKNTVAGAWNKFTKWISGSGSDLEMPSTGGSGDNTPVGQGAPVGGKGTANDYPYYSQKDPKWAKMSYSSGENKGTMGDAGCGPTAMAMVATKYRGSTDPTRIAEDAKNAGYRDSTGTNANFMSYESKKLGISSKETNNPTAEYISSNVGNGKSMILNGISMGEKESAFTNAGHYVVAVGKDKNGNILINDPRGKEYSRAISAEELASESRVGWTFNRGKTGGKGRSKVGKFFTDMKNKAIKKIIGGRGQDWIGCVRSVHKAMSAAGRKNNYQYNKSGICHTIKVGGKEYSVRWDCSGYVSACLQVYGVKKKGWVTNSGGFASKNCNIDKFKWMSWPGWDKLQEGDIMARNGHVEIFAYNKDGAHYVYNAGSTDAINATKPTHTGHKNGYTAIWRPNDPGQGVELQTDTAVGDSSSSSDASVDSSSSSDSSDVLSQISDVFSQYSTKAMNGLLKGQWDYNFNSNSDTSSSDSISGTDASNEVSGDIKVTGNNNVEKVWNFFTGKGFSPAATAGILGNMYQESGVNPASIQGNGKGPAAGIFQWENYNTKTSRFGNLYKRAKKAGKSWKDLGVQLDYALAEMKDNDINQRLAGKFGVIKKGGTNVTDIDGKKYVIKPVDGFEGYKKMTDESEAVKTFEGAFERAGKPNFKRRINYAKSVMKKYGNTGGNGEGDPEVSIQKSNPTHVESFDSSTEMLRTREIKNKVDTAFDTSRMEEILTKVYDVLLSIDGNTEGMRKAVKGLSSTTVNTQNIITSSGTQPSKAASKTQKSERTISGGSQTNANLAEQIARG